MRLHRRLALGASLLALLVSACTAGGGGTPSPITKPMVTVGSADFYEAALMAEIYAQGLEANGYTVDRQLSIGARPNFMPAIESGEINLLPEYIGSLTTFLTPEGEDSPASGDSQETFDALQGLLEARELTALQYSEAQDTNAFVVTRETADELSLTTLSDLAEHATDLTWGLPPECEGNNLCAGALEEYGIDFASLTVEPLAPCSTPMALAISEGEVDVAELCSTQPEIERFNLVWLEDDLATQPAENIAPIVRNDLLEAAPDDFEQILGAISEAMTTEELTTLNARVALDQEDPADVAREWLEDKGLV
jgi:osmoprotectant transport system substrate-binding protein